MSNVSLDPPPSFRSDRLLLRKPRPDDAPLLFANYASDTETARFTSYRPHKDIIQTQNWISNRIACWNDKSDFEFVLEYGGNPIGMMGMHPGPRWIGFGYVITKSLWGRGLTAEALTTLSDWALQQDNIYRTQAFCDVENLASARVMEKAGMVFEGVIRRYCIHPNIGPEPRDCKMYAKVR